MYVIETKTTCRGRGQLLEPGIYIDYKAMHTAGGLHEHTVPKMMLYAATRIWEERPDGSVRYIKCRNSGINGMGGCPEVDMDEYFWMKLKARDLGTI